MQEIQRAEWPMSMSNDGFSTVRTERPHRAPLNSAPREKNIALFFHSSTITLATHVCSLILGRK